MGAVFFVEQGVPLEVLDLRACHAGDRSVQFLGEIVVEVQEPLAAMWIEDPASFDWHVGIGRWDQVNFIEAPDTWWDSNEFDGNGLDENEEINE